MPKFMTISINYYDQTSYLNYCEFPYSSSQYLLWNGTCASSCPSPLTSSTSYSRNFCNYGCSTGRYLYYNGSCSSSCSSPLVSRTEAGEYYCDYPCSSTQSDFQKLDYSKTNFVSECLMKEFQIFYY